jgi:hypothetical protein
MAHFARLDSNNKVVGLVVITNDKLIDNGVESEQKGIDFCNNLFSRDFPDVTYKQTSYNTRGGKYYNADNTEGDQSKAFRVNYADIGGYYDPARNAFIRNKFYTNWVLNQTTLIYEPPITKTNPDSNWILTDNVTGDGYWENVL